jgi:hypothetical protein
MSVFWIPGYPGPPAPGPLQQPNFGPGEERRPKLSAEDPHEEAPHEENDGTTAKDQKTSSRAIPHEGKDHIHVSSARFHAEQEDKGRRLRTIHATPDRKEISFCRVCIKLHSGCWPPPPLKNRVDGAGRQRRTSASSTHSCGPVPILYKDYIYGRLTSTAILPPWLCVATPSPRR